MREILALTDRQIQNVYFHAREKDGTIRIPMPAVEAAPEVETEQSLIDQIEFLRSAGLIDEANYRQCVEDAKRKFNGGPQRQD